VREYLCGRSCFSYRDSDDIFSDAVDSYCSVGEWGIGIVERRERVDVVEGEDVSWSGEGSFGIDWSEGVERRRESSW